MLNNTDLSKINKEESREQQLKKAKSELFEYAKYTTTQIINDLIEQKNQGATQPLTEELQDGLYNLTHSYEKNKLYIALLPNKDIDIVLHPSVSTLSSDNFIFRITLNYDKGTCDKKGNSKYGTVENIEFGNKSTIESREKVPYKSEEVVKILESPRCVKRHNERTCAYSTIILKNCDYFKKQKPEQDIDFIFPIISNDKGTIESNQYIMDNLVEKENRTIFVPFAMDGHMVLARFHKDNEGQKHIDFMDSSGFFNNSIEYHKKLPTSLSTFLTNKEGKTHYLTHAVNGQFFQPQHRILPVAYDRLDLMLLEHKNKDDFLSGTCVYNTIGASNQIIKASLKNKDIANELKTCNSDKMMHLYAITHLYQASFEYTKQVLEKYLFPIHNSTKRQLEKIFDVFNLEKSNDSMYVSYSVLEQVSLNTIDMTYRESGNNIFLQGCFINNDTQDIVLIDFPEIDKSSTVSNTTIIGYQEISDNAIINKSALFGYGTIKKSKINETKILCSDILNSTLENSAIKSSYLSNVKSYGARIKDSDISNDSKKSCIILGDDNVNLSNINLNIDSDIKDDIIITTHDFLEKLKNAKEDKQYTEYFNFLKKHNIEIDELKSYDANNNGVIILSNSQNLDLEVNQNNNSSIKIKNKPNNLSNTQSVNNLDDKCKDTLSTMSVISTDIQTNKSSSKGIINTMSTDTSSTLSPLSIETPRTNEDKNTAKRGCCTCTTM